MLRLEGLEAAADLGDEFAPDDFGDVLATLRVHAALKSRYDIDGQALYKVHMLECLEKVVPHHLAPLALQ